MVVQKFRKARNTVGRGSDGGGGLVGRGWFGGGVGVVWWWFGGDVRVVRVGFGVVWGGVGVKFNWPCHIY